MARTRPHGWEVPDVPTGTLEASKRKVKAYAVEHGITIAQALAELIDRALGPSSEA